MLLRVSQHPAFAGIASLVEETCPMATDHAFTFRLDPCRDVDLARAPTEAGDPLRPECDRTGGQTITLSEVWRREQSRLLRFVSARTRAQDAEDIVQQAFARMAAIEAGPGVEKPGAYLRQTAHNLIRDAARLRSRQCADQHVGADQIALSDGDPVAHLEARDQLARLEQALSQLKPLTRQIFLARRFDGYGYSEIAQQTGLSVRGVEKQMSRAIKQLGRQLRHHA
jgi:RNA polymerase sigma-70 factor (ECF subfamily)